MLAYVPLLTTGIFLSLILLERLIPLRPLKHSAIKRLFTNACIIAIAFAVNAAFVQPTVRFMLQWTGLKSFGLIHLVTLPPTVKGAIAFLLMDLSFYYWHLCNHRFPWLWRFHNAHHIDLDLDVSTGFRFHFVEIAFSSVFRVVQIALIGVSVSTYAIYELVFQANTLLHHSNVRLPLGWERLLNFVLVTPRMHGIHHSQVQQEANSNYSVVFSWWDRLHHTLRFNIPQSEIAIGIPAYSHPDDNKLRNVFLMPFRPQRDYWRGADNTVVTREPSVLGEEITSPIS